MHFVIIGGDGVQLLGGGIYTPHPPPRFGTAGCLVPHQFQAELAKLTTHESNITQLIKVAKNLIKDSPELDVLVQEPMFRLEVEWKRLYNLMQCCNTQLKIYEENLPFYRILNQITKNTNDINELIIHPNKV